MIAQFADLDKQREIKIAALADSLGDNSIASGNDETGSFNMTHGGKTFLLYNIGENLEGEEYDVFSTMWWAYGGCRCAIVRASVYTRIYPTYVLHDGQDPDRNWEGLAKRILEMIDDNRFCYLCGQLVNWYGGGKHMICKSCALGEMKTPCVCCKVQMGRADDPSERLLMHPECKRRKMEIE